MSIQIPQQMTAVVLDSFSGAEALRIERRPVPEPGDNEILVKMAAASINPSDLLLLDGNYPLPKKLPFVAGIEGSGTVVAAGRGMMGRYLSGKRIACISAPAGDGTWAEYMVTDASTALPLNAAVSFEQGAMSVVNPLTAIALISIARQGGHKAIIHTAAASSLGQMMQRLGQSEGLQIIHIVRRAEQVDLLRSQGAQIVLNSSEPDFEQQLQSKCRELQPRLAFDAIAGQMTFRLFTAMPKGSKVTVYGILSQQAAQVLPEDLIFEGKSIDGFWLSSWMANKNLLQKLSIWRRAQKLIALELRTEVRAKYSLADARQAVLEYQNEMSGGKCLLVP